MPAAPPEAWLKARRRGLYVAPGDFWIDPSAAVDRAVISHGHADHARAGHRHALATAETHAIMDLRLGAGAPAHKQTAAYGEVLRIGEVTVRLAPAGHVLGSAQIVLDRGGTRVVVSGDYKRQADPTCAGFEPIGCDLFITEATFGLPVFRHPPATGEVARLLRSVALFDQRAHLVGVYSLGKAQRLVALLRAAGYDRPIYVHGALAGLNDLYARFGVDLGPLAPVTDQAGSDLAGRIVLAPPSATADRWSRRLPDPVVVAASGWMRVRQRARQRGVELPLILSDHADWDDLLATVEDVGAGEVWVTHGREEALCHALGRAGRRARALALVGREEESEAA